MDSLDVLDASRARHYFPPMRSRPKVKLLLSPGLVAPGERLLAEAVLTSTSETPVDFVAIRLTATEKIGVGVGKRSRAVHEAHIFEREWKSRPMTMAPGEHRFETAFDLPRSLPPTYVGLDAHIRHAISVHVSIPWWPDREQDFAVPVAFAPVPALAPEPKVFVTSRGGPSGKNPFMELSLDATRIALGDQVSGSISLQNFQGKRIRGVDLSFVETERVSQPRSDTREGRRFTLRVLDGMPAEGVAIPFRVVMPENATPTFSTSSLQITTDVEARVDVAWGQDITVRARVFVSPKASAPRAERGWVAPVGRQRQVLVWQNVAAKTGLVTDPEAQRMVGRQGNITIEIAAEHSDDYWLTAKLGWPNLGLDLAVGSRRWTDMLAASVVKSLDNAIDEVLSVHAREHAQAKVLATPEVLGALIGFERVEVDDAGGRLAVRGAAHSTEKVEGFVRAVLKAAALLDDAFARIPAPVLFAADVPAWEAFASQLRGRLELGRMWIHEAQVGTSTVAIGSVWARGGLHLGSIVVIAIDPPLE
ncbi:MAG: hypothetical protein K0S65_6551, partial [Labilithrix sp.]|nr:hypothetical protein [Labilithrix sp.]